MTALFTAQLAIHAVLFLPVLYLLLKHGRTGLLGWFFLLSFCSLQIIGGALVVGNSKDSTADIISSVGISPLLLAVDGILHEARQLRNPKISNGVEWLSVAFMHVLVVTGVVIFGIGAGDLADRNSKANPMSLIDIGVGLLLAAWVILFIWALISVLPRKHGQAPATHSKGTQVIHQRPCISLLVSSTDAHIPWFSNPKLLIGVIGAQCFIGIRVIYTLIAETTQKHDLNQITGSLAVRVVLDFLPGLLATLTFLVVGLKTRDVHLAKINESYEQGRKIRQGVY